jgi:hypothetical protein
VGTTQQVTTTGSACGFEEAEDGLDAAVACGDVGQVEFGEDGVDVCLDRLGRDEQ